MNLKVFLLLFIFLYPHIFRGQEARGFVAVSDSSRTVTGNTYALLVGISDYPHLRPLQYAAEDALLFYDFLCSSSGGHVPPSNIRLLINEEATAGGIMSRGISWLQNTIQPKSGDRIYIYLAGHGDAVDASEAYFLAYDANPAGDKNNYSVSGTINIQILKNRIRKFVQNGVEVVLIVDACRTADIPGGKNGLAGNYESILEEKGGELMFLSASPNEVSYEDKRFGHGHGLFTWHLINGIAGAADEDNNNEITMYELESYVRKRVRADSKQIGGIQTPVFCCSSHNDVVVSKSDPGFMAKMQAGHAEGADDFAFRLTTARNAIDEFDFSVPGLKESYFELKKYCREKSKVGFQKADSLFSELEKDYGMDTLSFIAEYYVGALLDEVQRAVNATLYDERELMDNFDPCDYYEVHYNYLRRAMMISPPNDDKMNQDYENRLAFLEIKKWNDGKRFLSSTWGPNNKILTYKIDGQLVSDTNGVVLLKSIDALKKLVRNGYETPALYMCQAELYARAEMFQEAAECAKAAHDKAPNWPRPYNVLIESYVNAGNIDSAEYYAFQRFERDTSMSRYVDMAEFYYGNTSDTLNIVKYCKLSLAQGDISRVYTDGLLMRIYNKTGEVDSALRYYRLRRAFHSFPIRSYLVSGRYRELLDSLDQHLRMGDTSMVSLASLYFICAEVIRDDKKAKNYLDIALRYDPLMHLGKIQLEHSRNAKAYFYLSLGEVSSWVNNPKTGTYFGIGFDEFQDSNDYIKMMSYYKLRNYYYRTNQMEKAYEVCSSIITPTSDAPDYIHFAEICAKLGMKEKAREALEMALQKNPYWYSRMIHIAWIYKEIGDLELAEKYENRAYQLGYNPRRKDDLDVLYGTVVNPECD